MVPLKEIIEKELIPKVLKPARYTNNEYGSIKKKHETVSVTMALCFPELYEIAMSNLGVQILYYLVNSQEQYVCERVFAPAKDMYDLMREKKVPLFSLESYTLIKDFDIIGFSLAHELTYTNFIQLLLLSEIPLYANERTKDDPYVFAGGHCMFNPMPVAPFLDFVIIGEGEEVLLEVLDYVEHNKDKDRKVFLEGITVIKGVYVPSLQNRTQKRFIKNLDALKLSDKMIIPYIETIHDRVNVEIMRGCSRACRFCQAGYILLPRREFSAETVLKQADTLLSYSGYDEISLTSLSSGDHSQIEFLLKSLIDKYQNKKINVALPSLRIDSFSDEVSKSIQTVRSSGLTLAPEAGTQRLRDVINKNITEEDIMKSIEKAVANKTNSIKLYFMIGLPTETQEDLKGIVSLAEKIKPILQKYKRAKCTINISNFVPKAHTPFQWVEQISIEEIRKKQDFFKKNIYGKQLQLRWHTPELSYIEGVFARGDERLAQVLVSVVKKGACFDSWYEHFDFSKWAEAFKECSLDPAEYFRERSINEKLPWSKIESGVSTAALIHEYQKALARV